MQLHTENGVIAHESIPALQTAMEIALKNSMIASRMKTEGRSPRMFYLPYDPQRDKDVLGDYLSRAFVQRMVGRACFQ